jgi:hypothetical protein
MYKVSTVVATIVVIVINKDKTKKDKVNGLNYDCRPCNYLCTRLSPSFV